MTFISRYLIYNKRARLWAILWTLLIFFLCFLPGDELPEVNIPFIDKWTHVALFAIFSLLWLCAIPAKNTRYIAAILLISSYTGWLVEYIQGHYIPHRSQDVVDMAADICGAFTGVIIFLILHKRQPAL